MKLSKMELERLANLPPESVPFVYMPCGCVGIKLYEDYYLSFKDCDHRHDEERFLTIRQHNPVSDGGRTFPKDVAPFTPVPKEEFIEIIEHLNQYISDGGVWQQFRHLVNWAMRKVETEPSPSPTEKDIPH